MAGVAEAVVRSGDRPALIHYALVRVFIAVRAGRHAVGIVADVLIGVIRNTARLLAGSNGLPKSMPKLVRIVIQLPMDLKTRLDGLKQQGYTTSGFIRAMLERELAKIDQQVPEQKPLTLVSPVKRANSR